MVLSSSLKIRHVKRGLSSLTRRFIPGMNARVFSLRINSLLNFKLARFGTLLLNPYLKFPARLLLFEKSFGGLWNWGEDYLRTRLLLEY